jgi:hypothetical protein
MSAPGVVAHHFVYDLDRATERGSLEADALIARQEALEIEWLIKVWALYSLGIVWEWF